MEVGILRASGGGFALAEGVRALYREGQTDYSLEPVVLVDRGGVPIGTIEEGDAVLFCCRRGEREIQLTDAFVCPEFDAFPRRQFRKLFFALMTLYHEKFHELPVAFAPNNLRDTLGEAVSDAGMRQIRIAESEKFAHVTFFFNGGNSHPFSGQATALIPSPRGVPFDEIPALAINQVARAIIRAVHDEYDLIVANFANGDVIGHTRNDLAKVRCAEAVEASRM